LNTKSYTFRWNNKAQDWREDRNLLLKLVSSNKYWKGSKEFHRTWGMISLGKPESCFFAEKLITQTNKDSEITGEVLDSFLRGWIGEKPISHTKDFPFFYKASKFPLS